MSFVFWKAPPAYSNNHKVIKYWPFTKRRSPTPKLICIGMHWWYALEMLWLCCQSAIRPIFHPVRSHKKMRLWKSLEVEESPTPTHTQHSSWFLTVVDHMDSSDALSAMPGDGFVLLRGKNMRNNGPQVINARDRHQRNSIFWFMMLRPFYEDAAAAIV